MKKKLTTIEFIKKAKNVHDDKYDYSLVDYKKSQIKIDIICPEHGVFRQTPNSHLSGKGCILCSGKFRKNIKTFINESNNIHNDRYDYSLVNYVNSHTKIDIVCPEHGIFRQTPRSHLNGHGCKKCFNNKLSEIKTSNTSTFILKAHDKHNNKYDYSLVEYINAKTKVKIICPEHGMFEQTPDSHLRKSGCPKCSISIGEREIINTLIEYGIQFESQKIFPECRNKQPLPFDFYLPNHQLLIEYDGIQHFQPVKHFGGIKKFNELKHCEKIKNMFCEKNNIKLLRISYENFNDIKNILKETLEKDE